MLNLKILFLFYITINNRIIKSIKIKRLDVYNVID